MQVDDNFLNALVEYLNRQPHGEVRHFIDYLQTAVGQQAPPPEPPKDPKEELKK